MSPLFSRSLSRCGKTITLENRDIQAPFFGTPDFNEIFSGGQDVKAIVKTIRGKTFFDGVATERPITHEMHIEYIEGVTAETWVSFKGRRIDILSVENCCENDEILILTCSDIGVGEAAKS